MNQIIEKPADFFNELGDLHDARIEFLRWTPKSRRLELGIDDINSNFAGLPDYLGFQPKIILLDDVSEIELIKSPCEDVLTIFEFTSTLKVNTHVVEIKCRPGGRIKLICSSISLMDPADAPHTARAVLVNPESF